MSKRFFWLTLAILAGIALYTTGWFWLAGQVESRLASAIATFNRAGNRAACDGLQVRGYPFRVGVFCEATYVESRASGTSFATGAFRSAAQVYNPFQLVAEADSPGRLIVPGMVPLELRWNLLASSARLSAPLPERVSLEAKGLEVLADIAGPDFVKLMTAEDFQLHMRPVGADLDLASRFTGLVLDTALTGGAISARFEGVADVSIKDGAGRLARGQAGLRGVSATVRAVQIGSGKGGLTMSGTASTTADGLINANLTLSATDPAATGAQLAALFPQAASQIITVFTGLSVLGGTTSLPLTVRDGRVSLSFLSLGMLPPLQ